MIEKIKHLPREEQTQVCLRIGAQRQLSGKELAALAERMVHSNDAEEVKRLKDEITRGFYGE